MTKPRGVTPTTPDVEAQGSVSRPVVPYGEIKTPQKPTADGERFPKRRQPEYTEWFSAQKYPCVCSEVPNHGLGPCGGFNERAHLKSRGAGGEDLENLVSLCTRHHLMLHRLGQRLFEFKLTRKLKPIARAITGWFYAEKKHGK